MNDLKGFPTFAQFLNAVSGYGPFPWQQRLADYVVENGYFPDAVTVPTGLGKTTSMLVHLYALARDVHLNGPRGRKIPLRCFLIVERRVVVDTSAELAERAAEAINNATDVSDELHPVRAALSTLIPEEMSDFEPVVSTVSLHGGIHTRGDWLRPVGAQLITATVTQIVSRMLFNGVGVSQNTRPMHAAVTGMDRVILLDEPHLSVPAIAALKDAENVQRAAALDIGVPVGQTVILGATAPEHVLSTANTRLTSGQDDEQHRFAGPRLRAAKQLELVTVPGTGAEAEKNLITAMVDAAVDAHIRDSSRGPEITGGRHGVVVFVNTVATARKVYEALERRNLKGARLRLVHGRMRQFDRPAIDLAPGDITVATQTLEVGADIDGFEVITQLCSLSALIQRAGRGNRYGELSGARVRVFTGEQVDAGTTAVYGKRAEALRSALVELMENGQKTIPVSPADISALRDAVVALSGEAALDPPTRTAVLRPQVARYAAYTDPGTKFPLEAFISGPDEPRNLDVTVAWRRSGALDLLSEAGVQDDETVQIPLTTLRSVLKLAATLKHGSQDHIADLDEGVTDEAIAKSKVTVPQSILERVRLRVGREWVTPRRVYDIAPGSMVVLDAALGGYIDGTNGAPGVDAARRDEVSDVSMAVACSRGRGRFLLDDDEEFSAELAGHFELDSSGVQANACATETLRSRGMIDDTTSAGVLPILVKSTKTDEDLIRFVILINTDGGELGDNVCRRTVNLADHSHQVGVWAGICAAVLPLGSTESEAISHSGYLHDRGKAERKFQEALGNRRAIGSAAWAKSRRNHSRAERRRLRAQAGLSPDWRHEVASAAGIADPLVRHLVVSHHMWGRPLIVHPDGGDDSRITEHVETFDHLTDTYGPWGLALLETVMRWADHRASAHPKTYSVDPVPVSPSLTPVPSELSTPDPAYQLRLPGLTASPMAGVLAAVGLLDRIVKDGLDLNPVVRWDPVTGVAVIGTSTDIRPDVVKMKHDTTPWELIDDQLKKFFGGAEKLDSVKGKISIPEGFDARDIPDIPGNLELFHQLLPDTQPIVREKLKRLWRLRCLLFSNNGSAFKNARHSASTEHFFDTNAGYAEVSKTDGSNGMDVHRDVYPGIRARRDTYAWALAGNAALGWGAANSEDDSTVVLPVPSRWSTLAGYRALAACGGLDSKGPSRIWKRVKTRTSEQLSVWEPIVDN